jgi:hypothetical protein
MKRMSTLAVRDHEGIERPAFLLESHEGVGLIVDWLRTGMSEIVHPERVRLVTDEQEWDLACEFNAFEGACFKCGQTKHDPRPFHLCDSCREAERQPQGEVVRLFTPAPNQIPGQLSF